MSCNCSVSTAEEVVNKVKMKGVDTALMDQAYTLECSCGAEVEMQTHLTTCSSCGNIFAVTPCQSDNIENVVMLSVN